ncbi:MAG TPA: phosphate ABC transporter permease subunit PstC [Thermodesulfobium narugense]|nr:phosphate ABC transporter permease subunit PstC [Thermodesulfobium narugense]
MFKKANFLFDFGALRLTNFSFFDLLLKLSALFLVLLPVLIFIVLFINSLPAIEHLGLSVFTTNNWDPVNDKFGVIAPLFVTVMVGVISTIFGLMISTPIAIFLSFYSRGKISSFFSTVIDALASIPSVVLGLWAIFYVAPHIDKIETIIKTLFGFIPFLNGTPSPFGLFTTILILTLMLVPIQTVLIKELIILVPKSLIEAGFSLGITKFEIVKCLILPFIREGIIAVIFLSLARGMEETMATAMLIGNRPFFPNSLFSPTATLTSIIANEFAEAFSRIYLSVLFELGLILFILVFTTNVLAKLLLRLLYRRA